MNLNSLFTHINGELYWSAPAGNNRIKAMTKAGTVDGNGYIRVKIGKSKHLAHRIIWEMHNGAIPDGMEIDHINHNKIDNRIENLRIVSKLINMQNKSKYKNNSSGVCGVSWHKVKCLWVSYIQKNKSRVMLGYFDDFFEAVCARKSAEISLEFHSNHGK